MWPFDNQGAASTVDLSACSSLPMPFAHGPQPGVPEMLMVVLRVGGLWALLFYGFVGAQRVGWLQFRRSSKPHENNEFIIAQMLNAMVKSIVVSSSANYLLIHEWNASDEAKFGCIPLGHTAGLLFGSYEAMDLVTGGLHGLMDAGLVVHHVLHISIGFIMFHNCGPDFLAACLMSQETTGFCYNLFLLGRYRYSEDTVKGVVTQASKYIFVTFFAIFRIGIGTYGAFSFLTTYSEQLVNNSRRPFASWQAHILAVAVSAGVVMQIYFFSTILAMVHREKIKKKKNATA